MKILIIYHSQCMDGSYSAAIAALAHEGAEKHFMALNYGADGGLYQLDGRALDHIPDLSTYQKIIFADICPNLKQLVSLTYNTRYCPAVTEEDGTLIKPARPASEIVVLDHHGVVDVAQFIEQCNVLGIKPDSNITTTAEMSGTLLSYWKFTADLTDPRLIGRIESLGSIAQLVSDRDLWKRSSARAFAYYEYAAPFIFKELDEYGTITDHAPTVQAAIDLIAQNDLDNHVARGLEMVAERDAKIAKSFEDMFIATNDLVPEPHVVCCVSRAVASETLYQAMHHFDTGLALNFTINGDTVNMSWRSLDDAPVNAQSVAQRTGGNGHPNAAGSQLPLAEFLKHWHVQ